MTSQHDSGQQDLDDLPITRALLGDASAITDNVRQQMSAGLDPGTVLSDAIGRLNGAMIMAIGRLESDLNQR